MHGLHKINSKTSKLKSDTAMSKPIDEKKSCRDCACLSESVGVYGPMHDFSLSGIGKTIGKPTVLSYLYCRQKKLSFDEKDLDNKLCEKFLRKKEGMTLEQQIEEQKQEQKRREEVAEQARITKEHNRLLNRLKRNWHYIIGAIGTIITVTIAIWKFLLGK